MQTPKVTNHTASATIPPGFTEVEFIFSATFTGTVSGVAFAGATDYSTSFRADSKERLDEIDFTVTAGSVRVKTI